MPGIFQWFKKLVKTKKEETTKSDGNKSYSAQLNYESTRIIEEQPDNIPSPITNFTKNPLILENNTTVLLDSCVDIVQDCDIEIGTINDTIKTCYVTETSYDDSGNSEDDSSSGEDDSFYENLFADNGPKLTYVSGTTDTFPCIESDNESDIFDTVNFFINENTFRAVAEYNDTEYSIGYLDLTEEEYSYLKIIVETELQLKFDRRMISLRDNKLYINRIGEPESSKNLDQSNVILKKFDKLGLVRIQFSKTEPFMAKYGDNIYFVGSKLCEDYIKLLYRSQKEAGTAIRIHKKRIIVDLESNLLDIKKNMKFGKQKEVCVISGKNDLGSNIPVENKNNKFRRYIVNNNPYDILEIDPTLIHASAHDDSTEIYAEIDFLFNETEKMQIIEKTKEMHTSNENLSESDDEDISMLNPLQLMELKTYATPNTIKCLVDTYVSNAELAKTELGELIEKKSLRGNVDDYISGHKMMIYLEEEEGNKFVKRFNQTDIELTYHMDRTFWLNVTVEMSKMAAAIDERLLDRFILKPRHKLEKSKNEIWGQVERVRENKIYLEIYRECFNDVRNSYKNTQYDIFFKVNRIPFQLQHLALEFIEKEQLFTRLINNSFYNCKHENLIVSNEKVIEGNLQMEGTSFNNLNKEQKTAVENIVSNVSMLPYILFGPPGTGKTRTLVAAVEQIVRTTNHNILICATSNAACDEIAERLVDILADGEMYRFYAKSLNVERSSLRVRKNSNVNGMDIIYPSLKYLYKFRVIICTLYSAGCLVRARKDKKVWRPDHFGFIFIDECASASESTTLIPIAGLCTSIKQVHAKIVLAGDPKQLDAVTKSTYSKRLGYNTSWLEQLCKTNLYSRDANTNKFNPKYITQLVQNYRSHPEILCIPNKLFYNNTLQACAPIHDTNWYLNSKLLPSKQFPIIFKAVHGNNESSTEHSWYNDAEIDAVVNVIKNLMPPKSTDLGLKRITQSDIGVVTPYRKQRFKICQRLRRLRFDEITVGTAEVFQGKERPVMIISTVRSNGQLGFVSEARRLNVVMTRAKCLVVIIGCPNTLESDPNWKCVIEHCKINNSFI